MATCMTKKLALLGMVFSASTIVGGFEDPLLVEEYDQGPVFTDDFCQTSMGFELCREIGQVDDTPIPLSIQCYRCALGALNLALSAELLEHFGRSLKNYTPQRGLWSLFPRLNTWKRIGRQIIFLPIGEFVSWKVRYYLYLMNKGFYWKFIVLRMLQYGSGHSVAAGTYEAIKEFCNARFRYLHPRRSLLGEECPVCYEENLDNRLIAPCGDERHPICTTCYPRLVRGTKQYQCHTCQRILPEQHISLRPVSIFEKIQRLGAPEKFRMGMLFLSEFLLVFSMFLVMHETFSAEFG